MDKLNDLVSPFFEEHVGMNVLLDDLETKASTCENAFASNSKHAIRERILMVIKVILSSQLGCELCDGNHCIVTIMVVRTTMASVD
jgi:hypothetical protein